MNAEIARDYLEDVVAKKRAIPYQRRSRKGRGGNTMNRLEATLHLSLIHI